MIVDIIGHFANFLYLVGSSFKEQINLRAAFVIAAVFELYYSFNQNEPLWTIIIWSGGFLFFNTYYLAKFIIEKKTLNLTSFEESIYYKSFSKIEKIMFKKLFKLAEIVEIEENKIIINQYEYSRNFYLIIEGIASVFIDNKFVTYLKDGSSVF